MNPLYTTPEIPEDRDRFFKPFPVDADHSQYRMIAVDLLIKSKGLAEASADRPSEVDRAIQHISNVAGGVAGATPRAPIDVRDNGDGTFLIIDGNATHEAAIRLGWKKLPCKILTAATLDDAIAIAAIVHKGQTDKAGAPYILHPLRLMMKITDPVAQAVAVLHDVVEDSTPEDKWTFERLAVEGFSKEVLDALECVTSRDGEHYDDFIDRAAANPIARSVKLADLEDNLNTLRIRSLRPKDLERIEKYHRSWQRLASLETKETNL